MLHFIPGPLHYRRYSSCINGISLAFGIITNRLLAFQDNIVATGSAAALGDRTETIMEERPKTPEMTEEDQRLLERGLAVMVRTAVRWNTTHNSPT
jgi:hypothetical protein